MTSGTSGSSSVVLVSSGRDIRTKMWCSILFTLIVLSIINGIATLECALPNQLTTRIFNSITEYEANKVPFNPTRPGWAGSNVEFNLTKIEVLQKNMFLTYDSLAIIKMKLSRKQIEKIDDGAFFGLNCLHELLLDHNDIKKLSRDTFQGLLHLEKLDLSFNSLVKLQDLSFLHLQNLKLLNLAKNQIKYVELLAFQNLTLLEDLNLESNKLDAIEADVFLQLQNLKTLNLAGNHLINTEPEKWAGLIKMEVLNLAGNGLTHFDPSYNFSFSNLKTLNLSSNLLIALNVEAMSRYLPKLGFIDLNDNPWICKDLQVIVHDLDGSRIKFASRNSSRSAVSGIACSDVSVPYVATTVAITTSTARKNESLSDKKYLEEIAEKKFKEVSDKFENSVQYLQNLVIILFVIVGLLIAFEILVKTNCCAVLYNRLCGQNGYLDNNDVEHFRLLRR